MVRRGPVAPFPFIVLLAGILALPGGAIAGDEEVSPMPAPARVAEWVLSDDDADLTRAVHALTGAPPAYVAAVIRHVRGLPAEPPKPEVALEKAAPPTVLLEARIYATRRGTAKMLLGERRMRGSHLLRAAEADVLRETLEAMPDAKVIRAPSLVVEDGIQGTVRMLAPISYLQSVKTETRDGVAVREPVFDVIQEGLVLEVRPVVSADRRFITLVGALTQTAVERPIPTREVRVEGGDGTAEVQAPTVKESRLDLHFTVRDGATVAGTGLAHPTEPEQELLVLLRVHLVPGAEVSPDPSETEKTRVVTMEMRLLRVESGVLERVLGGAVPDADEPLCGLAAAQVVGLLGPGRRGVAGVEILTASRLTTFDGQHANVSVLDQVSYVKDFEVRKNENGVMLDPVVGTLQDGLVFDVTPRINEDRTRIAFETRTTWAVLERPIADFTTTIEGHEVTIQIPELRVSRVRKDFEMQAGGYVLLGGFSDDASGRGTYVLLHAAVTDIRDDPDAADINLVPRGLTPPR